MTVPLRERLERLAAWADRFADPAFSLGAWVEPREPEDGMTQIGWFEMSEAGREFVAEMYEVGWVSDFDWMAWLGTAEGKRLSSGPDAVGAASAEGLGTLLTAILRSERFGDGQIVAAHESGLLLAIARRAGQLALDRRG